MLGLPPVAEKNLLCSYVQTTDICLADSTLICSAVEMAARSLPVGLGGELHF